MKCSIVYSTLTGNTKKLADVVNEVVKNCDYVGTPSEKALNSDLIFVGFWTDKGIANKEIEDFLKSLSNKKVFLFGSAGFGLPGYFDEILKNTKQLLNDTNEVVGTFMCRGKLRDTVKEKYLLMLKNEETKTRGEMLLDNYEKSLSHPNDEDLKKLKDEIIKVL